MKRNGKAMPVVAIPAAIAVVVAVLAAIALHTTSINRWLMTNPMLTSLDTIDQTSAKYFFNASGAFVLGSTVSGYAAQSVANFQSYATFQQDVGTVTSKWVMYDNENWTGTPVVEQQHPALYMQDFASLAHKHNLKVIEAPAQDLVHVSGADCVAMTGETSWAAYLRCRLPADARYADILEIQAQADQPDVTTYALVVGSAKTQVRAVNSSIGLMAGLTTDRGDSVTQIFDCWKASVVSNFWMNTQAASISKASSVLDEIRAAGG